MSAAPSLVETIQGLLERTYRMQSGLPDIGRYIIGDEGFRRLYGEAHLGSGVGSGGGDGARTLVRESPDGVRACIYYPDALIRRLEMHPPQRGLRDTNVEAFATLVEELDHLLFIAERASLDRPLTLFELELHANISKHLVLSRFLAGSGRRILAHQRAWLRHHLFEAPTYCDEDPEVRSRYRDAASWALRFIGTVERLGKERRIETLRRFHTLPSAEKVELIDRMAA
jgi:hypothetical protein